MRKTLKKVAAGAMAAALAMTVVVAAGNTASAKKAAKKAAAFDPGADYFASIGFQQGASWIFHDECTSPTTGLTGTDLNGLKYETDVMQSGDNGTEKVSGTITSAELKGNGTYTVKVEGLDGALTETTDADGVMKMIYLTTNIPADAQDKVTFSDVKLTMDGMDIELPATQFFKPETLKDGYLSLYLVDNYAKDQGEYTDSPDVRNPNDSIEITFTIAGFTKDNPEAVPATPTPEPKKDTSSASSDTSEKSESSGNTGLVVGIVVAAVVVIGGVAVVVTKKKK